MRAIIFLIPPLIALLYVTFYLGQMNQRRKNREVVRANPAPVIAALRNLLAADPTSMPHDHQVRRLAAHDALANYDTPEIP